MLSDDYTHVHGAGNVDDRHGFIQGILSHPRTVRRGSISVRLYGGVAILLGDQVNRRGGHRNLRDPAAGRSQGFCGLAVRGQHK